MAKFVVIVTVADPKRTLHSEDYESEPWGTYLVEGKDEEDALYDFIWNIPIKVLDDFKIEVLKVKQVL